MSSRSLLQLVFVVLVLFLLNQGEVIANAVFHIAAQGHRLRNSMIKQTTASNPIHCGQLCIREGLHCMAVNFGISSNICELNNQTSEPCKPDNLVPDKDFNYFERSKKGKQSFCLDSGQSHSDGIPNSVILQVNKTFFNQLKNWLPSKCDRLRLCYRATRDGWVASDFHSRCDNKGAAVTIVKMRKYIFGGYVDVSWGGAIRQIKSTEAFIFSFVNKDGLEPFKASIRDGHDMDAIYNDNTYGPIFGFAPGPPDFAIASNANTTSDSVSNIGRTYQIPNGYTLGSSNAQALLAGSLYFTPSEVEVFSLG